MEEQMTAKDKLTTFAMLGQMYKEEREKRGITLEKTFEQCIDESKDIEDPVKRLQSAMSNYAEVILKTMPLENRCNYILNKLSSAIADNIDESQFNWDKINQILFNNPLDYDYNLCESVHSIKELNELRMRIIESSVFDGPWYKIKCKNCKDTFYLSQGELNSYLKKGLQIPKRCKNCIMESKGQESYRQKKQREEKEREAVRKSFLPEDNRSAMQIAFENAKKKKKG